MNHEIEYKQYIETITTRKKTSLSYSKIEGRNTNLIQCNNIPPLILISLIDHCPVGDGPLYENFIVDAMGKIFSNIIDNKRVLMHGVCQGGYYDIEFPFCTENLPKFQFWESWHYMYEIKAIIVEVKNTMEKMGPDISRQIKAYITGNKKGRFGILVSRNGFTLGARKELSCYAKDEKHLILPITHQDIKLLLKLSLRGAYDVYKYLRIKETQLLRIR